MFEVQIARFAQLDPAVLYGVLQLRAATFIVEQGCAYNDVDGRDMEPGTWHLWTADDAGAPVAYLRILDQPDGSVQIGRVVTAQRARRRGLAGVLIAKAIEVIGDTPAELNAQTYAVPLYAKYGFAISGPEFVEDGIPHVPMRRAQPAWT